MEQIASRLSDLPTREFRPEQMVMTEGGSDGCLYVLVAGAVAVVRGGVQVVVVDTPGAMFGEMSVLRDVPHSASVKAVAEATFYVVHEARQWLEQHPDMALYVANLLAERLANTTALLVEAQAADGPDAAGHSGLFTRLFGALSGTRQAIAAFDMPPGGGRFIHE